MTAITVRNPARRHRRALSVVLCAVSLAVCSCERTPIASRPAIAPAAEQTYTLGSDAAHPEVSVRLSADRSQMTVADRLTLKLTIASTDGVSVSWTPSPPEPPTGKLGDFTVAASADRSLPAPVGRSVNERTLVLEPFLDGAKTIPAITLDVRSADAGTPTRTITTQPIEVTVAPVIPPDQVERAKLAPPHAPLQPTLPSHHGNPLIAALAVAGVLAWLGAFALARFVAPRRAAAISPLAETRARLADLRRRLAAAQAEPFASGAPTTPAIAADLAATLRMYLNQHLHVDAQGATAIELRPRLEHAGAIPGSLAASTAETIEALERYAFAPTQPRCSDLLPLLETTERLVLATADRTAQPTEADA